MGRQRSGLEQLVGGLGFAGITVLLYQLHWVGGWILAVGILFGVLPALSGLRRMIRQAEDRRRQKWEALEGRRALEVERRDSLEKTILQIAKDRRGVVTPPQVVLRSDLRLDEAEKALQDLAARGYAEMRVKENGTIDYVFHDLI